MRVRVLQERIGLWKSGKGQRGTAHICIGRDDDACPVLVLCWQKGPREVEAGQPGAGAGAGAGEGLLCKVGRCWTCGAQVWLSKEPEMEGLGRQRWETDRSNRRLTKCDGRMPSCTGPRVKNELPPVMFSPMSSIVTSLAFDTMLTTRVSPWASSTTVPGVSAWMITLRPTSSSSVRRYLWALRTMWGTEVALSAAVSAPTVLTTDVPGE